MSFTYSVWGMALSASFELPGDPCPDELETDVELRLVRRAEWPGGQRLWKGELGDGEPLILERADDGSHLLAYGEQASYLIDPEARLVSCAAADSGSDAWRRVLLDAVLATVAVLRGGEALHCSAVETAAGVVAVVAPSGSGKTTLAAELLERGGALFSDDLVVISATPDGPRAQPAAPVMSLPPALVEGGPPAWVRSVLAEDGGQTWVLAPSAGTGERELGAICFLSWPDVSSTELTPVTGTPLDLLPHLMTLDLGTERAAARFQLLSDLAERTPCYRLEAGPDATPERLAELVEDAPARLEVHQ